jgi:hypothetical protein
VHDRVEGGLAIRDDSTMRGAMQSPAGCDDSLMWTFVLVAGCDDSCTTARRAVGRSVTIR